MTEQERGGTWYTVRHARTKRRKVIIVWPDGSFENPHIIPPGNGSTLHQYDGDVSA